MKKIYLFFFILFSGSQLFSQTFSTFIARLNQLPESQRTAVVDSFMSTVMAFPFIEQDTLAHFIYLGSASRVTMAGDANAWNATTSPLTKSSGTNFWYRTEVYEHDARLDYKFVINGSNWILDPRNPNIVTGGYGPNSELRMPAYQMPPEIAYYPMIPHGTLKDTTMHSVNMVNSRKIRVYLPPDYTNSTVRYPLLLVHDGLDYITLANATNIIDYLIHQQQIEPLIAVFVPPVDRTAEYAGNLQAKFTKFIIEEIIPWTDARFRTNPIPEKRAVLGESNGGNISLWLALNHPEIFGNVAAQSSNIQGSIYAGFQNNPCMNIKMYLDLGTYDIPLLIPLVRNFIPILEAKGYTYKYHEYHEGHSWGFWRAHIDDVLCMFFPCQASSIKFNEQQTAKKFDLMQNYPNPFNGETKIRFHCQDDDLVALYIYNINGQLIRELADTVKVTGTQTITWDGKDTYGTPQSSGLYLCQLIVQNKVIAWQRMVLLR